MAVLKALSSSVGAGGLMEVSMDYRKHIGDGKLPNRYWVFHYDEKFKSIIDEDGTTEIVPINEDTETKNSFLGEFKTYKEALNCVDRNAFYPHVVIEDRLTGQVFELMVIVCPCCGKEDYETYEDIHFSKEAIEKAGYAFV